MQPYFRSLDLVWPGHLHGTGCLSARAMDTGFPTVVWCLCVGPGCVWARVSAAPRHSWLGCWGRCVFVCLLRLYPTTPGWGVRCGCACLGSGFGRPATPGWGVGVCVCSCARSACTPPLLAGVCGALRLYPATPGWGVRRGCVCFGLVFGCAPLLLAGLLGCVRVRVPAPLVPRHSWLGCAARSACTPPLLARSCGVAVCALAWVSAAPRNSWLGFWGVRVLVRPLRLYPATPGWGVRRGCVCFGLGFDCALPLLAGVLGCLCVRVCTPLVPRHSWLGCAARSACTPPLLAGMCGVAVCALAWVSTAPRHSWLGCWGVCVLVRPLRLYPATPGWGVRRGCVYFGLRFDRALPLLAGVLGCLCVRVCTPLVPRHSWLGCAARSACTPPLLAGVCGVAVCALAWVSAAPRHSWLGCWGVCVLVRPLRLYPATPGWGVRCGCVCFGLGFGCAPPLVAGVSGCVCARAPAPLVPRHSWLRCAAWVCVLWLGFRLRPATGGPGVGLCVCSCARSACTPPLLAGVWGVGVCALAWVLAAPRHSWLGCWGVCVLVRPLRLYPATPGWGVRCACVCFGLGFGCTPPLLAGVSGCVCARAPAPLVPRHSWLGCAAWVCVLWLGFRLRPATRGWGVGLCVCSCARSACTPSLLAGVWGVGVSALAWVLAAPRSSWLGFWGVCVFVCALGLYPATPGWGVQRAALVPRHSWLGCAAWVCVLWLGFRLSPATPGWGVGVCVCSCARSACTRPLLAGVCGVGVCALAWVPAAPRHSWLGCWGVPDWCCVAPVPVPWFVACCARRPGLRHPVAVVAWHLSVCLGCGRQRASLACLVAPLWCAAPHPVWSLSVLRSAFLTPWCLSPPRGLAPPAFTGWLRGARGGRPRTGVIVPAAGLRRGWGAGLAPSRTTLGPRDGVVPGGSLRRQSWAACAAVVGVCGRRH